MPTDDKSWLANALVDAGLNMVDVGLGIVRAANNGDLETAQQYLAEMRGKWQEGSDALDAALAARTASDET